MVETVDKKAFKAGLGYIARSVIADSFEKKVIRQCFLKA